MKKIIGVLVIIFVIIVAVGVYALTKDTPRNEQVINNDTNEGLNADRSGEEERDEDEETTEDEENENKAKTTIGTSVDGNDIQAYHFGNGDTEILFVGGLHGGYDSNTTLVAYDTIDYLRKEPGVIPDNVKVTVIPVVNPDGLKKVVGTTGRFSQSDVSTSEAKSVAGRFNANQVDLNRNFDCDWQSTGVWQNKEVDAGTAAFSEPESQAIRDYVTSNNLAAAVVWYSAAGGVYASSCRNGVLSETRALTNLYADASGYRAFEEFDYYEITGDMVNWLAKEKIPGISVLLTNHTDVEWDKNKAGIDAVLEYYAR